MVFSILLQINDAVEVAKESFFQIENPYLRLLLLALFIAVGYLSWRLILKNKKISALAEKKDEEIKSLHKDQSAELKEMNTKLLESSENNMNLFFDFENAITELIRLNKIIKTVSRESMELQKDIRMQLDYILKNGK